MVYEKTAKGMGDNDFSMPNKKLDGKDDGGSVERETTFPAGFGRIRRNLQLV